ncbi:MAG: Gfo/Idh/MocA family oxidoreductase [Gemmatimonadaceae bacterium]
MTAPLRIGVIGCGAIATSVHIRVLRGLPNVRVTALADPAPAALDRAANIVPGAARLASAEELLARDDIDAVVVAAPTGLHAALALSVIASGRHLYLEKPIAATTEDGSRVVAAARDSKLVTVIGFNWRYQPLVARARELVRAGVLGDVHTVSTVFSEPSELPAWKVNRTAGGGVLLDLGSHHFDLIRWMLGVEVEHVESTLRSDASEQDSASVRLRLSGNATASCSFSFRAARADSFELIGTRGVLRIDRYARSLTVTGVRARTQTLAILAWRTRALIRPRTEPSWSELLRAFVEGIRGHASAMPTFDDGLRSLEIVVAAERAAGAG